MKYAPVMIPTLCRYDKLVRCIESLRKNSWAKYTEVYVAVDYPSKESHWNGYNRICEYLEQDFLEFKAMHIIKRTNNYGAASNCQALREKVLESHDRFIYTDDDIEFSPNFLEYIDKTMEYYDDDPDVIAVCGYSYPLEWKVSSGSNIFKSTTGCFTWGTGFWKNKYTLLRSELVNGVLRAEYEKGNRNLWKRKLIDARYIEFLGLGISKEKGLLDKASDVGIGIYMELFDKYSVIPVLSKARNYGFDGSGVVCQSIESDVFAFNASEYDYQNQEIDNENQFEVYPDKLQLDADNKKLWNEFDCRKNIRSQVFILNMKHILLTLLGEEIYEKVKRIIRR